MTQQNVIPLTTHFETINSLREHLEQRILGQEALVLRLIIALLCDGHLMVEGAPGLAKTRAVKELAMAIEGSFHRIQFTPDLLPGDLTGTDVFHQETNKFAFQPGPLFHNLLLADEINRAPAKVQSALLEAMAERQITIGQSTYQLPDLFLVMATQNPIEQEGTYPLPEAQLDRFLLHTRVGYPNVDVERNILKMAAQEARDGVRVRPPSKPIITIPMILAIRREVMDVHISKELEDYIVQLINATRHPEPYGMELKQWLRYGASPRATIGLDRASRAHAWIHNRDYITPGDIHAIAHDVLRHRLILSYEAEAEGITTDRFITELLGRVPIP